MTSPRQAGGRIPGAAWRRLRSLSPRTALTGVAMLLLVAAMLGPRWATTHSAYDFVVVLDITQSMNVLDYEIDGKPVSRLAYAKHVLRQTLPDLPCGSRIGWAIFTEFRVLLLMAPVDVCDNYQELVSSLDHIDGRMAWANSSEIAKGLFWGLRTVRELGGGDGIVFMTDGHESPPLNPRYRPAFEGSPPGAGKPYTFMDLRTREFEPVYDGKPGDIRGLIVGVGGDQLKPIPKVDADGRSLGFWQPDEVMQVDIYSARNARGSPEEQPGQDGKATPAGLPKMMEHLSSLRGAHLQDLAQEAGLGYHRLSDAPALLHALTAAQFARPAPYRADLSIPLAALALALLATTYLPGLRGTVTPPRRWIGAGGQT